LFVSHFREEADVGIALAFLSGTVEHDARPQ
jgi:hypothetical protein